MIHYFNFELGTSKEPQVLRLNISHLRWRTSRRRVPGIFFLLPVQVHVVATTDGTREPCSVWKLSFPAHRGSGNRYARRSDMVQWFIVSKIVSYTTYSTYNFTYDCCNKRAAHSVHLAGLILSPCFVVTASDIRLAKKICVHLHKEANAISQGHGNPSAVSLRQKV